MAIIKGRYIDLFFILLLLKVNICPGQTFISGNVSSNSEAVAFASIILSPENSPQIIAYTLTDTLGKYQLEIDTTGSFLLITSMIGYQKDTVNIDIEKAGNNKNQNIILKGKTFEIEEVTISAEKSIVIRNDTIVVLADAFRRGDEVVLEDLLKRIPGLEIDDEGKIRVHGKEIEKVMVEGDDFFERGYTLLTKNMPSAPIDKVEILQHYSNNPLLKGIENSEKVALNLTLKEEAKGIWFGNVSMGYDVFSKDRYQGKGNLMNFKKKTKYYFLTSLNNIGINELGNASPSSFNLDAESPEGRAHQFLNLSVANPYLKEQRTLLNNQELGSLNAIFNPTTKLKVKLSLILNGDEKKFITNTVDSVSTRSISFVNRENYRLRNKHTSILSNVNIQYRDSLNYSLEFQSKYYANSQTDASNFALNSNLSLESLTTEHNLFSQNFLFTKKLKDRDVFLLRAQYTQEKAPQNYNLSNPVFREAIPELKDKETLNQNTTSELQLFSIESQYIKKWPNGNLFDVHVGNNIKSDKLGHLISSNDNGLLQYEEFESNEAEIQTKDLFITGKYTLDVNKFKIHSKLELHQLFNSFNDSLSQKQAIFFVNPVLGVDYTPSSKHKFTSAYSFNKKNIQINDIYGSLIISGSNSLSSGLGRFDQLSSSTFLLSYQSGDWGGRIFSNASLLYNINHDYISYNSRIFQNFSINQKTIIKDQTLWNANYNIDYYISKLKSNLKLKLSFSNNQYENFINDSESRNIIYNNYNFGIEFRTGWIGIFNFHLGSQWSHNQVTSPLRSNFSKIVSFCDLSFILNKKLSIELNSDLYFWDNLPPGKNIYYFFDANLRYTLIPNTLTLSVDLRNAFDNRYFRSISINDLGSSITEYLIQPRILITKIEMRF